MRNKVAVVNLEQNMPSVEVAITNMTNTLVSYRKQGYKAVILIHGYGSTGVGGSIKVAVRKHLSTGSLKGVVRTYCGGEQWVLRKKEILNICRDLEGYEYTVNDNEGVTIVILSNK